MSCTDMSCGRFESSRKPHFRKCSTTEALSTTNALAVPSPLAEVSATSHKTSRKPWRRFGAKATYFSSSLCKKQRTGEANAARASAESARNCQLIFIAFLDASNAKCSAEAYRILRSIQVRAVQSFFGRHETKEWSTLTRTSSTRLIR